LLVASPDDGEPVPLTPDGLLRRAAAASSCMPPEARSSPPPSPPRDPERLGRHSRTWGNGNVIASSLLRRGVSRPASLRNLRTAHRGGSGVAASCMGSTQPLAWGRQGRSARPGEIRQKSGKLVLGWAARETSMSRPQSSTPTRRSGPPGRGVSRPSPRSTESNDSNSARRVASWRWPRFDSWIGSRPQAGWSKSAPARSTSTPSQRRSTRPRPDRSPEFTMQTVAPNDTAKPLCLARLLQDRLHLDEQLDRVADHHPAAVHGDVGRDVEVLAVDLAGG
jgi:hypothetical protein